MILEKYIIKLFVLYILEELCTNGPSNVFISAQLILWKTLTEEFRGSYFKTLKLHGSENKTATQVAQT